MGRLTLNVLLSFAQFEREVTGERIRDKIAASRKKGMWMGGNPPVGYDVCERKLIVNQEEADRVRPIFERYLELESVTLLAEDLKRRGIRSKSWRSQKGVQRGGGVFSRGALYALLKNRTYLGQVAHRGEVYDGEHEAILSCEIWERAQQMLKNNRRKDGKKPSTVSKSLLSGLLFDDRGHPMSPTHAKKRSGKRYRYYVSQAIVKGQSREAGSNPRIPAHEIEELIMDRVKGLLTNAQREHWNEMIPAERAERIREIVQRVDLHAEHVEIRVNKCVAGGGKRTKIRIPFQLEKWGGERIISLPDGYEHNHKPRLDRALIKAVARAHSWREELEQGKTTSVADLAEKEGCTERYIRKLIGLAFLAPDITENILRGTLPPHLTLEHIVGLDLPLSWTDQRQKLGIYEKQSA